MTESKEESDVSVGGAKHPQIHCEALQILFAKYPSMKEWCLANVCWEKLQLYQILWDEDIAYHFIQWLNKCYPYRDHTLKDIINEIKHRQTATQTSDIDDDDESVHPNNQVSSASTTNTENSNRNRRQYICEECGKVYKTYQGWSEHISVVHRGLRPFHCNICNKSFGRRSCLIVHKRWHLPIKPFQCEFDGCNKSFVQKSDLVNHRHTHTGAKPFVCSICHKSFSQTSNLRQHRKLHSNQTNATGQLS